MRPMLAMIGAGQETEAVRPASRGRPSHIAWVALSLALVALALMALPETILEPPRPSGGGIAALVRLVTSKQDAAQLAFEARMRHLRTAGACAAIAAVGLAIIAVLRRERRAPAFWALGVAAVALVWQYVVVGVIVAVILLILTGLTG
jgi:hypothetical protein